VVFDRMSVTVLDMPTLQDAEFVECHVGLPFSRWG
jgi:hypothetical protein